MHCKVWEEHAHDLSAEKDKDIICILGSFSILIKNNVLLLVLDHQFLITNNFEKVGGN